MRWIIAIIIIVAIAIFIIMFMHGTTCRRPDWYRQELDDEQMKAVSEMNMKNHFSENNEEKRAE